ncbi:MAG TPA: alpha/beta fold hydrolase [Stellaceae bacterium]|nr:alpha/beta fold hydrolase [Stellaceae bacterium]
MARFVLVHGACHGGWCWEKVVPLLIGMGHQAAAPDLPGMGDDPTPQRQVTLALWADFVADIARNGRELAVLVGHSRGGTVISEAAERVPEHVLGLVYLTAALLPPGRPIMEALEGGTSSLTETATIDQEGIAMTLDPATARDAFYGHCDPADADRALARLCSEPLAPNTVPLTVTAARWGRVKRAYIECLDDRALTIETQRRMQAALPCDPVVSIDTDHSPFLSTPRQLAEHLVAIAAGWR